MDMQNATDQELEDVIRRVTNTHVDGSQFQRASLELDIRRKRRLFEQQEKLYDTVQTKADKIIHLLSHVTKKPITSALVAALVAIAIGVTVNITSAWLQKLLGLN
ncbi:MAG TPA: hypothetical protein VJM32_04015 [Candidatus Saccharimonadales bacterium]|nr:hypothetical protein [Candidatus Saccharimonadales bacterium]